VHSPDVIKVQNIPEEHSATLDSQLETKGPSPLAKTISPPCPPSEEIGLVPHVDVEMAGFQEEALEPCPDTSGLEQSNSAMALVPLIPEDATPEVVFQFVLESNTVQIPAHL